MDMKITQSTIIKYTAVILCLGATIKLAMTQEADVRKDVSRFRQRLLQTTTLSPRTIQPHIVNWNQC
uniref:Uncharacterized protein n=1 Tax=Tetranychus urticae TaxID=32264 RepID=T1K2V9_TETUR